MATSFSLDSRLSHVVRVLVVWVRRRAFESKYANVVQDKKTRRRSSFDQSRGSSDSDSISNYSRDLAPLPARIRGQSQDIVPGEPESSKEASSDEKPCGDEWVEECQVNTAAQCLPDHSSANTPPESVYLAKKPSAASLLGTFRSFGQAIVGRNSQFYGLSREEREQLGCIEYKALKLLSCLVPAYLIIFQILGSVGLSTYIALNRPSVALANGVNPWWVGIFDGVSAFNNAGMSLLDASLTSYYVLLTISFLTLVGNTASSHYQEWGEIIEFILKYPRRVYTHLFPSTPTWYLLVVLFLFNGMDFIAFETLNRSNPVLTSLPPIIRNLDVLAQTITIRSAGFAVISISSLRIGLQAFYVPMMFISAFPVAITMRSSNVYEERSLGIYSHQPRQSDPDAGDTSSLLTCQSRTRLYFLRQQLQNQLSHDFWFVLICTILIIWIETGSYDRDPLTFSVFNIMFEVVSADLPVAIDRAVQLPDSIIGDVKQEEEEEVEEEAEVEVEVHREIEKEIEREVAEDEFSKLIYTSTIRNDSRLFLLFIISTSLSVCLHLSFPPLKTLNNIKSSSSSSILNFTMQSKFIITLAALASVTQLVTGQGFTIPEDQPDGTYNVTIGSNGNHIHTLIGNITDTEGLKAQASPLRHSAKFCARDDNPDPNKIPNDAETSCTGNLISGDDIGKAIGKLEDQCVNSPVEKGPGIYSKSGDVVAYMCNYGGPNPCVQHEVIRAGAMIMSLYGDKGPVLGASWVLIGEWAKGYGYDKVCALRAFSSHFQASQIRLQALGN
ncbi:hypothetical protein G7Y89_g11456 [Cudoniella acicularis]|uniref:Uncharacterized protein n=1 Tax=Cudoniella acicularis TaxID=354080 RepID=A0A8H4VY97_9HELO|nr:hypothetical protein G7Y89_g11456 [Cudoniella acicularis]